MGITKADFSDIDKRIESIIKQPVEEINIDVELPPTIDELEDSNKTYSIMATILFIDIRKSTYLTEISQAKSMVKIYRAFMRMAVDSVRKNGGVTRQFLGDRIMGVFLDSKDENDMVNLGVDKAVNCARTLQTIIDFSLNKHLKNNVNNKIIECGIGIDYGKVLVTKVGMYGVEKNELKENETDCVWVGKTTNYASKYSDIAKGGEIFISDNVYKNISAELKDNVEWQKCSRYKGNKLFRGYIKEGYYLDFYTELGNAVKTENSESCCENDIKLDEAIEKIEETNEVLRKKNEELITKEIKLNSKDDDIKRKIKRLEIEKEKYKSDVEDFYECLCNIVSECHCKRDIIQKLGINYLEMIIKKIYELGEVLEYDTEKITSKLDCSLIDIYNYFYMYNKAYETTIIMARNNNIWIKITSEALGWAKKNNIVWKLREVIQDRIDDDNNLVNKKFLYDALLEIKRIVGY